LGGAPNIDGMRITPETIVDKQAALYLICDGICTFCASNHD